ncbi:hypothetical protein ACSBR2_017885 [Camellia fascicularis]
MFPDEKISSSILLLIEWIMRVEKKRKKKIINRQFCTYFSFRFFLCIYKFWRGKEKSLLTVWE